MCFRLIFLVFFTFSFYEAPFLYAMESDEDWNQKMWLIHASPIMLKDSEAVAGALHLGNPSLVMEEDECIHHRMTLHHCLGNVVPEETFTINGVGQVGGTKSGHVVKRPYVYMAPWREFGNEIVGGIPLDLFTFGNHTYGPQSVVFIPQLEEELFRERNLGFEGTCVFYNPSCQDLSELVKEQLVLRHALLFNYEGVDLKKPFTTLGLTKVNGSPWENYEEDFKTRVFFFGLHCNNLFAVLERILAQFAPPFLCKESFKGSFYHNHQNLIFLTGALFSLIEEKYFKDKPKRHNTFEDWKKDVYLWLDLYSAMKEALDDGKELGPTHLNTLLSLRRDPAGLSEFFAALPKVTKEPAKEKSKMDPFEDFLSNCKPSAHLRSGESCLEYIHRLDSVPPQMRSEITTTLILLFGIDKVGKLTQTINKWH